MYYTILTLTFTQAVYFIANNHYVQGPVPTTINSAFFSHLKWFILLQKMRVL